MEDREKTKEDLLSEVRELRCRVAELERAERDLRESEERFRLMADAAPVMLWVSGPDTLCTFFNKPWLEFTGRTTEQELGNGWAEGVHPDDLARCVTTYLSAFHQRACFSMEYRLRRRDGTYRWIEDTGVPRLAETGEFLGYIGSCVDITDHRSLEDELRGVKRALEHRVRERTDELLAANAALREEIAERTRAELELACELEVNSALTDLFVPLLSPGASITDIAHVVLGKAKALTRSRHGYVGEIDSRTGNMVPHTLTSMMREGCDIPAGSGELDISFPMSEDGRYGGLWGVALNTGEPFMTNDAGDHPAVTGVPAGHVPIDRFLSVPVLIGERLVGQIALANPEGDYTHRDADSVKRLAKCYALGIQRTRVEDSLRDSERTLAAILKATPTGIGLAENRKLVWANDAYRELFGFESVEDYAGREARFLYTTEDDYERVGQLYDDLKDGAPRGIDVNCTRKDGSTFVGHLMLNAFDPNDPRQRVICSLTDITWRKQAEEKQRELMEEVRHFAYVVSHDLRAPLANLRGFSGELERAVDILGPAIELGLGQLPEGEHMPSVTAFSEDLPEALRFINAAVSHMERLINAILRLSRLGHTELLLERLSLNDMVRETLDTLAHQIGSMGIRVTVGSLPCVIGDRIALEQILVNLLDNAIKYLDTNRPGEIAIAGWTLGNEHFVAMTDNGMGIDSRDREKIFDVFYRANDRSIPGEGMGLAYVKALVRRHGGRIWCDSVPGTGSVFTFTVSSRLTEGTKAP